MLGLGSIPGIGLVRRTVTAALLGAAFWGGMAFERALTADRCRDAGGAVGAGGVCLGAAR